jgi:YVTN family beta-propeller protein
LDYRILGPLEVCDEGRTIGLAGDKQRVLLAILLLHANEVVSADGLIDGLWGERPPPSALNALHVHVSRLRRALEDAADPPPASADGALVTRGRGYVLRVGAGELDVGRFRDLVEQGRQALADGDGADAARILRHALALWRGPPLAEFKYEPFAQSAIAQLEELRIAALEERVEADIALGHHGELLAELAALVEQHPLRERLRGQFMLALYRCGRQAEALSVYQQFRRTLSEQLGRDPGPGLRELELAILARDASLDCDSTGTASSSPATGLSDLPRAAGPAHRRRVRLVIGGCTLVAAALAAVAIASSGGGAAPPTLIAADAVGAINPSGGTLRAVVPLGTPPSALAAGYGAVWVTDYDAGTVSRVDPSTRVVVQTIAVGSTPGGIAVGGGAVCVANNYAGTVSRIDPTVNRVVQTIAVGTRPAGSRSATAQCG